jgi:2-dehydropantoate 2-reductase
MKAGIIGAGSLGSLFAHYFHEQLIDFVIYEKNREIVSAVSRDGLTLIKGETSRIIKPSIGSSPEILHDAEIIFLFVKSYSTVNAIEDVSDSISKKSVIVSLQNGLGNIEEIRKFLEPERIVYGATTIGAAKSSLSTVVSGGSGIINIGGAENGNVLRVHHLLNSAGFNSYMVDNPDFYLWHKAIINAGINPIAAILGIPNGEIPENKYASMLQENIIREAAESAAANNVQIDYSEILKITREVCEKTSANICSMLQDIRNGRETEIESINGKIIQYGESKGLNLPYNKSLFLLIKSMEGKAVKMP